MVINHLQVAGWSSKYSAFAFFHLWLERTTFWGQLQLGVCHSQFIFMKGNLHKLHWFLSVFAGPKLSLIRDIDINACWLGRFWFDLGWFLFDLGFRIWPLILFGMLEVESDYSYIYYKIYKVFASHCGLARVVAAGGSGRCGEPVGSSCETENGIDGK